MPADVQIEADSTIVILLPHAIIAIMQTVITESQIFAQMNFIVYKFTTI